MNKDLGLAGSRSYLPINMTDLERLSKIAELDREHFLKSNPRYSPLKENVICVALCQGAALHYINGKNGIKDFDIWTFYKKIKTISFYPRRETHADFGDPKFGKSPDRPYFIGRRVDLLGRSIDSFELKDPVKILREHLSEGYQRKDWTYYLSKKAVVLIDPPELRGKIVWPQ